MKKWISNPDNQARVQFILKLRRAGWSLEAAREEWDRENNS